jgi:hypothetical protein
LSLIGLSALGFVEVLWVRDSPNGAHLALLICISVAFGMFAAQLPPVRVWLDRRDKRDRP